MSFLLNWREWLLKASLAALSLIAASALSGYFGFRAGYERRDAAAAAEQLEKSRETVRLLENNSQASSQLQAQSDQLRRTKDAKIARINTELADALDRLRQRPERPSGTDLPQSAGADSAPSCTGAQLYRPDAEFLSREAARAQGLLVHLAECQAALAGVRAKLGDLQGGAP